MFSLTSVHFKRSKTDLCLYGGRSSMVTMSEGSRWNTSLWFSVTIGNSMQVLSFPVIKYRFSDCISSSRTRTESKFCRRTRSTLAKVPHTLTPNRSSSSGSFTNWGIVFSTTMTYYSYDSHQRNRSSNGVRNYLE